MNRIAALLALVLVFPAAVRAHSDVVPHLDLEMTGEEYRALLDQSPLASRSHALDRVIQMGKRNLDWLRHINDRRDASLPKLSFSSKETQTGIPITEPGRSNVAIVQQRFDALRAEIPPELRAVIYDGAAFTDTPPIAEKDYLDWGRKADRIYQSAARWILQEPYLFAYAARRTRDIRGYHFLTLEADRDAKLEGWDGLAAGDRERLKPLLVGLCLNTRGDEAACARELDSASDKLGFYKKYEGRAAQIYRSYFELRNPRPEAVWTRANPDQMLFPFSDPGNEEVRSFLKTNLEDEWRLNDWRLTLRFDAPSPWLARIRFEPGATPNVNGQGGDTITMDANTPLTEYNVQWTIRHEFGHVLGLPDCYVEFYDTTRREMINYQIDIENIMCSRKGRILPLHFEELKRSYYR